jgi:hypothetical protein
MALCCLRIFSFLFQWSKDMPITLGDTSITGLGVGSGIPANTLSGRVAAANANLGAVLQVIQNTTDGGGTTSTNDYAEMLNASITPTSASSRILIFYQIGASTGDNQPFSARIRRNTTVVGSNTAAGGSSRQGNMASAANAQYSPQHQMQVIKGHFLDSPATTSAITYRLDISPRSDIGNREWRLGQIWSETGAGYSMPVKTTIILMEIA